jgi:hypothetical protein
MPKRPRKQPEAELSCVRIIWLRRVWPCGCIDSVNQDLEPWTEFFDRVFCDLHNDRPEREPPLPHLAMIYDVEP